MGTIHTIWIGNKPIRPDLEANMQRMADLHDHRHWTNIDFLGMDWYEQTRGMAPNIQSNIARLWVLAEHGGIYLDLDVKLFRPLDDLFAMTGFLVEEPWPRPGRWKKLVPEPHLCANAVMGCDVSKTSLMWQVWAYTRDWFLDASHKMLKAAFGPGLVSVWRSVLTMNDWTVLPTEAFYPLGTKTAESALLNHHPTAYGAHYEAGTWRN